MRAVTLERRTRRLVQLWTVTTTASAGAAMILTLTAGGTSQWARWLLGLVSIYGFVAATRYRVSLHLGIVSGIAMVAIVPHDATLDRGVVAAVGAVLVLLASESAHITRRLITIAPVQSTRPDLRALTTLVVAAAMALVVTGAVAQLDRWSLRALILGLVVAGAAVFALVGQASSDAG